MISKTTENTGNADLYPVEDAKLELALHHMAADLLDKGMVDDAWKTLLAFNAR